MSLIIENPYAESSSARYDWLKGNLHTHTTRSDGAQPPQDVLDAYAEKGYDFLALSDHDIWADYSNLNARGMILIQGNEVTANGPHVLQVSGERRVEPKKDRQQVIHDITSNGGFAVLNHPNWQEKFDHFTFAELMRLENYTGIEIYNGVCFGHAGSGYALDKWDRLLHAGRRAWGFAHDDSHSFASIGMGWNVVRVREDRRSPEGIIEAIRNGSFYASSGVTIHSIDVRGTNIQISSDAQAIEVIGDCGKRLEYVERGELSFDASSADCCYIRLQLYGVGRRQAWTQPFFLRGGMADRRRELESTVNSRPKPSLRTLRVSDRIDPARASEHAAWKDAPETLLAYNLKTGFEPDVQTAVKALVTPTHLIFNFRCDEPNIDKLTVKTTRKGEAATYSDECIELFLDVEGTRERYYQIIANAAANHAASHHNGWEKDLRFECTSQRTASGWNLQIALLLDSLGPGVNTKPGAKYGLHVCRNRPGANKNYVWAWVVSNHTPERFGTIEI